jgi:hypothetical protein
MRCDGQCVGTRCDRQCGLEAFQIKRNPRGVWLPYRGDRRALEAVTAGPQPDGATGAAAKFERAVRAGAHARASTRTVEDLDPSAGQRPKRAVEDRSVHASLVPRRTGQRLASDQQAPKRANDQPLSQAHDSSGCSGSRLRSCWKQIVFVYHWTSGAGSMEQQPARRLEGWSSFSQVLRKEV